ncbi:MAG: right-handed parallel beta-helix repeat-containing protein [Planctomycetota bacterium]
MRKLTFLLVWLVLSIPCSGKVVYVDADASGANNGTSWADAYNYLQDALMVSSAGNEIRVAEGTYKPDQFVLSARPNLGRAETFQLKSGVAIKGGYAGTGAADPDARDIELYKTILSGDLAGDDNGSANISENSYRVVTGTNTDSTALLDGFVVTASCGERPDECGGIYNRPGSPTIANCTFIDNWALYGYSGNAIYNRLCSPTITNCMINGSGRNNGIFNELSDVTISNCVFIRNRQCGIQSYGGSLILSNCLFDDNDWALFIDYCNPIIRNCTFSRNNRVIKYDGGSTATFNNCIVWENFESFFAETVNYSCVQGYWNVGTGNITENPQFVDAGNGNYRLLKDSPCINAGDPSYIHGPGEADLDGNPRIIGGRIDIGAYEYQGPRVIYVDDDATGNNDGTSWADAYNYLQDALMMASAGDEVRVGRGTYKPDQFVLSKRPNLGRMETFQLKNGVVIKGGYAGLGAPDPNAWHAWTYDTILSGDLNGDDVAVDDPCDMGTEPTRTENSLHVVTSSGTDRTAVLDGFHITGGQADGTFPHSHGGGLHNFGGNPTVNWCNIQWNYASGGGGGMSSEGEPNFNLCYFSRNDTGGSGGGLYVWSGNATLTVCNFYTNSAGWGGGGLAIQTASATVTGSTFSTNTAGINGGGICCDGGTYTLADCIFRYNSAERGGALWNIDCTAGRWDNPVLDYCRFYNNEATNGGGMFNSFSTPILVLCTFHRNSAQSFGGGVYNEDGSAASFEDCSFNENQAEVRGGGMSNHGSSPELIKCSFTSNYAGDGGGGMNNTSSSGPKLLDCLFEENTIFDGGGGGMYNFGNPTLTDCAFIGNTAPYESGGGINNYGSLTLTRCVFIDNSGARGGGIHCVEGSATLSSCLLIANSGSEWAGVPVCTKQAFK